MLRFVALKPYYILWYVPYLFLACFSLKGASGALARNPHYGVSYIFLAFLPCNVQQVVHWRGILITVYTVPFSGSFTAKGYLGEDPEWIGSENTSEPVLLDESFLLFIALTLQKIPYTSIVAAPPRLAA